MIILVKQVFRILVLHKILHFYATLVHNFWIGVSSFQFLRITCIFPVALFTVFNIFIDIFLDGLNFSSLWLKWRFWPVELSAIRVYILKDSQIEKSKRTSLYKVNSKGWNTICMFFKSSPCVEQLPKVIIGNVDTLRNLFILMALSEESSLPQARIYVSWGSKKVKLLSFRAWGLISFALSRRSISGLVTGVWKRGHWASNSLRVSSFHKFMLGNQKTESVSHLL